MLTNQAPAPQVVNLPRTQLRALKRNAKAQQYAAAGLNGKRAVARRHGWEVRLTGTRGHFELT